MIRKVKSKKVKVKSVEILRCAQNDDRDRRGAALLVVLFVVMAITILSLGFLSRSDVELACGENMILRTQMDYLAESGLEHAKGLILNPQDVDAEYWTGDTGQQLAAGSVDFYDVNVVKLGECNYQITCDAYRERGGEQVGRSSLTSELRLDPAIALWTGTSMTVWDGAIVNGDVYCNGTLINEGLIKIDGDVFANTVSGAGSIAGRQKAVGDLSLGWPRVTVAGFISKYPTVAIGASVSGQTFGPYEPVRVCYRDGDLELAGNVTINGMLVVNGDLTVRGDGNVITAAKNLPALLVANDLIVEGGGVLDVNGLVVVDGEVQISADSANASVSGGLFAKDGVVEAIEDSSGNGRRAVLCGGPTWQPAGGQINGALEFDGDDDYVEVRDESSFDITSQITVAAWIKVNAFTRSFQAIATKGDNAWRIQRWSDTNYIEFACTGLPHNTHGNVMGDISVNDGQWHHVAGVYNGSAIYLYVDGTMDVSEASSGTINTNNYKVMLGENAQQRNRYWDGLIDEVRIYNRALDANDVNDVYQFGGDSSGLLVHWGFDEQGSNIDITSAPLKTAVVVWSQEGAEEKWGQAAEAFFKSIRRN